MPATIHIVDDDESFRISTSRLLRACGYVVEAYTSAEDFLERQPSSSADACILLDVRMPGLDGPALQSGLGRSRSDFPIVFLSAYLDIPATVRVIKAGADDLLTKPVEMTVLVRSIERALARARNLRIEHDRQELLASRFDRLSPREHQVFELVARGRANKEIARELGTTERTIKAHRHRVMEKMKANSVAELVVMAERLGVLSSPREA